MAKAHSSGEIAAEARAKPGLDLPGALLLVLGAAPFELAARFASPA